ncbi:MAG: NAD(P)H-hydrate dehydratase [Saprospiraceae bacterium]|nr:NAD(P)H-hydrate dehydratase [Saprospiraceae bacterium]
MKLLNAQQIKSWDNYTIKKEPVASIDLMERAATSFTDWYLQQPQFQHQDIIIFCGNGNNGGDGLAIARMLRDKSYHVVVYVLRFVKEDSVDFDVNLGRLMNYGDVKVHFIHEQIPDLPSGAMVIDALLGYGVNKPTSGMLSQLIKSINLVATHKVISVDMPSGLPSEGLATGDVVLADEVFTFQLPKLSFFLKEHQNYVKKWVVGDIQLHPDYQASADSVYFLTDHELALSLHKNRTDFQHKGDFGHALIIAGCEGKIGAAILATKACLRAGAGLVTAMVPETMQQVFYGSIPEAMVSISGQTCFSTDHAEFDVDNTIGCGPGLGKDISTEKALIKLLNEVKNPMVLDADALNIVAKEKHLLKLIPKFSIITPHPKEFERLFGKTANSEEMFELQRKKSMEYDLIIVLKGAYTRISTPEGKVFINSTGNPGMATGGTGDVLTGIITGLLAQKYNPEEAAVLGVFIHGLAGDIALDKESHESLLASDIILNIGAAFKTLV